MPSSKAELFLLIQLFFTIITTTQSAQRSLNNNWKLTNHKKNIEISDIQLPSGVYTELEKANATESVLRSFNDVKTRWISKENWSYYSEFEVSDELDHEKVLLNFYGLDTFADIYLNDEKIGSSDNMFLTYRFDVKKCLKKGTNKLKLDFISAVTEASRKYLELGVYVPPECPPKEYNGECHMNIVRKMQASFSWDWGLAAPSVGIWRDVELEYFDSAVITEVITKIELNSDPGTGERFWRLAVTAYFLKHNYEGQEISGVLTSEILGLPGTKKEFSSSLQLNKDNELFLTAITEIPYETIETWWPNGYGEQKLYNLKVTWEDSRNNEVTRKENRIMGHEKTVRIGFRTVELVQDILPNGLTFYFKINGVAMFMKGSNWIPSHILPEESANKDRVTHLLQAARDGHMNMLRVWGGGLYESDMFYDIADEMGILLWHDMMFACAMYRDDQEFLDSVRLETNQNVKRIQHHPSLALWATNNENEVALRQNWYKTSANFSGFAQSYKKLYVDTIEDEIKKIDTVTPLLTSSPSNGKKPKSSEEEGIGFYPQDPHYGDIHYYNYVANGWDYNLYPQPRFASEYGFQSYPSIRSWQTAIDVNDNFDELLRHRQHHPLGNAPIDLLLAMNVGQIGNRWDLKIYLSQISQAMTTKVESEMYRVGRNGIMNTMGALYWQLNDVWVAPSWSSIEFTGHYKILYYWMKQVFAPKTLTVIFNKLRRVVMVGVSDEINVQPEQHTIKMVLYKWNSLVPQDHKYWNFIIKPNDIVVAGTFDIYGYLHENNFNLFEHVAEFTLLDSKNQEVNKEYIFPAKLKDTKGVQDPNLRLEKIYESCENETGTVIFDVIAQYPAIFVYLEVMNMDVEQYELTENGFMQFEAIKSVGITYKNPNCQLKIVETEVKVLHLNEILRS